MNDFVEDFNYWLATLVAIIGILQLGCTAFVAWVIQKSRADLAEFELRLMNGIREILKGYVPSQQFNDFLVLNQKEHSEYEKINDQFQHWQYKEMEPVVRMMQSNIADHEKRLDNLEGLS